MNKFNYMVMMLFVGSLCAMQQEPGDEAFGVGYDYGAAASEWTYLDEMSCAGLSAASSRTADHRELDAVLLYDGEDQAPSTHIDRTPRQARIKLGPYICALAGLDGSTLELGKERGCHTEELPYKCAECGKGFDRKWNLKIHMLTHTKERSFVCLKCQTRFNHQSALKRHELTHMEERPFVCSEPECGKSFKSKRELDVHMRIHMDPQFVCAECDKKFTFIGNLRKHMLTHTGARPYECAECGKRFSQSSNLKVHEHRFHAGKQLVECDEVAHVSEPAQSSSVYSE
jgi:uncharacterized Zn-finger protein